MTINFTFVPPYPEALSGPAFISQTEKAFNELGTHVKAIAATGDEALVTARNALITANNAAITANDAQGAAQNAQDAANVAQMTADIAAAKGGSALETALGAYDVATNAESKADAAKSAADTAQNMADSAKEWAENAQILATNADTMANSTRSMASAAMGEYIVVLDSEGENPEPDDADEYFQAAEKLYFVGGNLLNFPIQAPFYFDVYITNDGGKAFQRAFTGNLSWSREADLRTVTDPSTGETETVAAWTEWSAGFGGDTIPKGIISLWSGAVDAIPVGWALCDGADNTPDLRDRSCSFTAPENVHAIQWQEGAGHIEYEDGQHNTPISGIEDYALNVVPYVTHWEEAKCMAKDSLSILADVSYC